jgi:hypothetical protein
MYNLMVGNEVNISEDGKRIVTPLSNSTGLQSSDAIGFKWDAETNSPTGFPWSGTVAFANENKHGTYYSDYSGSIVEEYVNNYKTILESDYGVDVVEARLITKNELTSEDIGCSAGEWTCTTSEHAWIYSTSYWSGSADITDYVWYVCRNGNFNDFGSYDDDDGFGVRPVIIISKSNF